MDQPLAQVRGADLVDAMLVFEEGEAEIRGWTQLCALVLWSELCGVEVSCQWTAQALHVLQNSVTPEAGFFPWASPVWQHGLAEALCGEPGEDTLHEMALRRGLNPVLIRGLASSAGSAALDASHLAHARDLLCDHGTATRLSGTEVGLWRLDRYYSSEATGSSLGVAAETRRFRASLFQWLSDSNRTVDEHFLIAEALLHLREHVPIRAVSCNSFLFRWRTRYPFSYQELTLGELHQVLGFLDQGPPDTIADYQSRSSHPRPASRMPVLQARENPVETRRFQVSLYDHQTASGTICRVPAHMIGQDLIPDILTADRPMRLSALVQEYERTTGRTVIVAINGGYFLDARTVPRDHPEWLGKPLGLLKIDNQVIAGPFYTGRPILCLDHEHRIVLRFVAKGLCSLEDAPLGEAYTWSDDEGEYEGVRAAIEAGPLLIRTGKLDLNLEREQWGSASARAIQAAPVEMSDLRTSRTVIASARNGDINLVTVYGRVPESVGMTHMELAHWLQVEIPEMNWAIEMDAGGSVTAWHVDAGVTTIGSCPGELERPIASAILFSTDRSS